VQGADLAGFIDQSFLRPDARKHDFDRACDQVLLHRFRGLVIPSGAIHHAKRRLAGSGIKIVATVAFPHGTAAPDIKAAEAGRAAAAGADEIDYVIAIGAAMDEDQKYLHEEAVAILRQTRGKIVKAILEIGYLTDRQRVEAAKVLAGAGVPYVKTCTGFGPGEATARDVEMLVRATAGKALVKASGGIRTRARCVELLQAGAAVLGTSHGPEICKDVE